MMERRDRARAGAGSGVLHAFEPQGSMAAALRVGMVDVVATGLGCSAGLGAGLLRLKAELKSGCGEVIAGGD